MAGKALTESVTLNNGRKMPLFGLGTWQSEPGKVEAAVYHALKVGYRHIDGAYLYLNEKEVGRGLKRGMQDFNIKREELFVTSKLWMTKTNPEDIEPSCRQSLSDLGLEYLDLYLIHWPYSKVKGEENLPMKDGKPLNDYSIHPTNTWLEMEKLQSLGLTKSIGVSNFNSKQIQDILEKGKIVPVVNQVECHPYLNQTKLNNFCKERKIILTAYSPLGSPARPSAKPGDPVLLEEPKLQAIAAKHSKSVAQVLIRWQIQRGIIVIPKSVTPSRIEDNSKVFDFTLSDQEMKDIESLDMGPKGRLIKIPYDVEHPHYPFHEEF